MVLELIVSSSLLPLLPFLTVMERGRGQGGPRLRQVRGGSNGFEGPEQLQKGGEWETGTAPLNKVIVIISFLKPTVNAP